MNNIQTTQQERVSKFITSNPEAVKQIDDAALRQHDAERLRLATELRDARLSRQQRMIAAAKVRDAAEAAFHRALNAFRAAGNVHREAYMDCVTIDGQCDHTENLLKVQLARIAPDIIEQTSTAMMLLANVIQMRVTSTASLAQDAEGNRVLHTYTNAPEARPALAWLRQTREEVNQMFMTASTGAKIAQKCAEIIAEAKIQVRPFADPETVTRALEKNWLPY